jgi:hypothetical protein
MRQSRIFEAGLDSRRAIAAAREEMP